jgi:hypothetical protein
MTPQLIWYEEELADSLIAMHRRSIRSFRLTMTAIIVSGILVMIMAQVLGAYLNSEVVKSMFTIGGGFIATISLPNYKEVIVRQDKVAFLEGVKSMCAKYRDSSSPEEVEQIRKTLRELLNKGAPA